MQQLVTNPTSNNIFCGGRDMSREEMIALIIEKCEERGFIPLENLKNQEDLKNVSIDHPKEN